jgi:hydrogenase maturation protease
MKRILIAGIGNIFLGDDAFGVEVARAMLQRTQPPEAEVIDFGIRSYDLAYALVDPYDAIILVDATPRGGTPGTLYLIEPDLAELGQLQRGAIDAHSMDPVSVFQLAASLGGLHTPPYLVGCEPAELDCPEGQLGLSAPVREAVPRAIEMIETLVGSLLRLETGIDAGLAPV